MFDPFPPEHPTVVENTSSMATALTSKWLMSALPYSLAMGDPFRKVRFDGSNRAAGVGLGARRHTRSRSGWT